MNAPETIARPRLRKPQNKARLIEAANEVIYSDPILVQAEWLRRKLKRFVVAAWPIIEPGRVFQDNWHIDAICEHLEAVTWGQITNLIINIPPRFMKSSLVSVLWPAWEWAQKPEVGDDGQLVIRPGMPGPHLQYLTGSYDAELAMRDAVNSRRLIQSPWYQRRFGDNYTLTGDQNAKGRYQNNKNGHRIVVSAGGSVVGEGGDRILIDDPHDAVKAMNSDADRKKALDWMDHGMSTRKNDPKRSATVLIMQRVAVDDATGHMLSKCKQSGEPVEHLVIPMEYEGKKLITSLGTYDPRTKTGALLWEERFDKQSVKNLKAKLGDYGTNAQLQQRPTPRGGVIFKQDKFKWYKTLPQMDEVAISLDCTFKDATTSDFVAIQAWGRKQQEKFLLKRHKEKLDFSGTLTLCKVWRALFPNAVAFLVEDKANGPAVINTLQKEIPGMIGWNPGGASKLERGYACQPQMDAGQVWLPDPSIYPEIADYISEVCAVPGAPNDDEFDATTQMLLWFSQRGGFYGLYDYYQQQHSQQEVKMPSETPEQWQKSSQQLWQEEQDRQARAAGLQVKHDLSPWQRGPHGRKK